MRTRRIAIDGDLCDKFEEKFRKKTWNDAFAYALNQNAVLLNIMDIAKKHPENTLAVKILDSIKKLG